MVLEHKHNENCSYSDYLHYLVAAAPDILWYDVQDVGSYSGSVFAVGKYDGKVLIYQDYYGSCSGCGGWGSGGEPTSQKEVLEKSELFSNHEDAFIALAKIDHMDKPDIDKMVKGIKEIKL